MKLSFDGLVGADINPRLRKMKRTLRMVGGGCMATIFGIGGKSHYRVGGAGGFTSAEQTREPEDC